MAGEPTNRLTGVNSTERWLALEIRSWKLGFIVLEGNDLLEWGTRRFRPGVMSTAIHKLAFLLRIYAPSIVITRSTRRAKHPSSSDAAHLLRSFCQELELRSVPFVVLSRDEVRNSFVQQGYTSKNEIARVVAGRFERLTPRIPRSRKPWDPERGMVVVFDAAATAIAFERLREATPT